jgi:hypothetical protein
MVRLVHENGMPWLAAAGYLMAAADFEIMGRDDGEQVIPPLALLGAVPEPVAERARFWELHILEVLTGLPGDAREGAVPRASATCADCGGGMRSKGCGAWSITGPPG